MVSMCVSVEHAPHVVSIAAEAAAPNANYVHVFCFTACGKTLKANYLTCDTMREILAKGYVRLAIGPFAYTRYSNLSAIF